jgi:hypothetical protein
VPSRCASAADRFSTSAQARASNDLHEVDLVGPVYLRLVIDTGRGNLTAY